MQEWLNWPLSKSGMGQLIEGSNPSLSAIDIMKITIITIGKKHEAWVQPGIFRFLERLRAPFAAEMIILPHSSFEGDRARQEESERIFHALLQMTSLFCSMSAARTYHRQNYPT